MSSDVAGVDRAAPAAALPIGDKSLDHSYDRCSYDEMQTLLASIGLCQPQPKVPSELIRFLGKTYCAWHSATWMLEQHVMIFPADPRCFDALVCPTL